MAVDGYHGHPSLHPVCAGAGYGEYLLDFTRLFHDDRTHYAGGAYLHNADDGRVGDLYDYPRTNWGSASSPASGGVSSLTFLRSRLAPSTVRRTRTCSSAPGSRRARSCSPSLPTRSVREQFVLLDEQEVAFDIVLHEVEKAAPVITRAS